jgi:hypothetical protein
VAHTEAGPKIRQFPGSKGRGGRTTTTAIPTIPIPTIPIHIPIATVATIPIATIATIPIPIAIATV